MKSTFNLEKFLHISLSLPLSNLLIPVSETLRHLEPRHPLTRPQIKNEPTISHQIQRLVCLRKPTANTARNIDIFHDV